MNQIERQAIAVMHGNWTYEWARMIYAATMAEPEKLKSYQLDFILSENIRATGEAVLTRAAQLIGPPKVDVVVLKRHINPRGYRMASAHVPGAPEVVAEQPGAFRKAIGLAGYAAHWYVPSHSTFKESVETITYRRKALVLKNSKGEVISSLQEKV
jgi:hypothetical protein